MTVKTSSVISGRKVFEALAMDTNNELFYILDKDGLLSHVRLFEIFKGIEHTIVESVDFSAAEGEPFLGASGCINNGLKIYCSRRYSRKLDPDSTMVKLSLKVIGIQKIIGISSKTIDGFSFEIDKSDFKEFFLKNFL